MFRASQRSRSSSAIALTIASTLLFVLTSPGLAYAQNTFSIQGGSFSPWRGEPGSSAIFQYTHQLGRGHHLGTEFEYRKFKGEVADIKNVDLEQFLFRIFYRVDLVLDSRVTPYLGFGFGAGSNEFNDNKVEQALNVRNPGARYRLVSHALVDMLGLVGIDVVIPRAEWASLFGEARFNYTAQFTNFDDLNDTSDWLNPNRTDKGAYDNAGGVSAQVGVRLRF